MVSGTDHQLGFFHQQPEVFFDHRDLGIQIKRRAQVQQIAADHNQVVFAGMGQDPVILLQGKVQVG